MSNLWVRKDIIMENIKSTNNELENVNTASLSDKEYFAEHFDPIIRFAIASDVHLDTEYPDVEFERLANVFEDTYRYSENHKTYNKLDGVFFDGDNACPGTLDAMKIFFGIVDEHVREGTVVRAVLGNHDFDGDVTGAANNIMEAGGYDSPDAHLIIKGFHFILLSTSVERRGKDYEPDKQAWLAAQIKAAAEDDPTGRRPIFVFHHFPISETIFDSAWSRETLRPIIEKYPQVIDFSGHSHYPVNDPRSVWQGEFTAVGCGALCFFEQDYSEKEGCLIMPSRDGYQGDNVSEHKDAAHYIIVEADANNAVKIMGYSLNVHDFIMEPIYIRSVGDPSQFKYTDARKTNAKAPEFSADAQIEIVNIDSESIKVKFPQGHGEEPVLHYRCGVYNNDGLVNEFYSKSCYSITPMPKEFIAMIRELSPDTEYSMKITAISPWKKESEPICLTFKTEKI